MRREPRGTSCGFEAPVASERVGTIFCLLCVAKRKPERNTTMRKLSRKSSSPKNTTLTIHQNPDGAGPSQEDEDEEEMMAAMGSMFSRPRNLGDGVASGLKVAAAGVLGGVASLVAATHRRRAKHDLWCNVR